MQSVEHCCRVIIIQLAAWVGIPAAGVSGVEGGRPGLRWGGGFAVHDHDARRSPLSLPLNSFSASQRSATAVRSQTDKPVGAVLHSVRNVTTTRRRRRGTVYFRVCARSVVVGVGVIVTRCSIPLMDQSIAAGILRSPLHCFCFPNSNQVTISFVNVVVIRTQLGTHQIVL